MNTLDSNLPDCPFPTRVTSLTALHARYQLGSVQMDASLINTYVKEHVETGDKPEDLKKLSPSFSINWRPLSEQDFSCERCIKVPSVLLLSMIYIIID